MAVKYSCPKCSKRFVDWGAEKLNFKCPECTDETLVLVGHESSQTRSAKRPSLKRAAATAKKKAAAARAPKVDVALEDAVLADVEVGEGSSDLLDADHDMDDADAPLPDGKSAPAKPAKKKTAAKTKAKAKTKKPAAKPKAKAKAKPKAKAKAKPKAKVKAKKKAKK